MVKNDLEKQLIELLKPEVEKNNFELYHLELTKEDGVEYLRLYIDNEEGITLRDCEIVSRSIDKILDEADPIPYSYCLEVSSSGIGRKLYNDVHLNKYKGAEVTLKIKGTFEGNKVIIGVLDHFDEETIYISMDNIIKNIPRKKIKDIFLKEDL